jgi:toxin ParE1/3/4
VRNLLLRPAAEDDLAKLYRYIAEQSGSLERAIGYIRRIRAACEKLKTFPEVGRSRDDLRPGVRVLGFERRVVIVYTVLSCGDVEIGRVLYGGRDYETLISDENEP